MPTPSKKETEDEFINRCIPELIKEGKESDQAYAVCKSKWDNKDFSKNIIAIRKLRNGTT